MGFIDTSTAVLGGGTLVTTTETVVLTSIFPLPVGPSMLHLAGGSGIQIKFDAIVSFGTGTTSFTVRVRRGINTTGAIDGQISNVVGFTVGSPSMISLPVISVQPNWLLGSGGQYSITLQQNGASANGSVSNASAIYYYIG